ncbi:hypothetical protein O181_045890 [Austropuccinia psidii MF-1]|uniref:Metallo-beta-lactamase domain-containing protein n=1 Tax=Austropuccinia psidii MF-1 TaxID=1389203 RepID=A0A9Q3DMH4_9BASI|nr:hypothetical protein [Austropuccinia psidii MF-1]
MAAPAMVDRNTQKTQAVFGKGATRPCSLAVAQGYAYPSQTLIMSSGHNEHIGRTRTAVIELSEEEGIRYTGYSVQSQLSGMIVSLSSELGGIAPLDQQQSIKQETRSDQAIAPHPNPSPLSFKICRSIIVLALLVCHTFAQQYGPDGVPYDPASPPPIGHLDNRGPKEAWVAGLKSKVTYQKNLVQQTECARNQSMLGQKYSWFTAAPKAPAQFNHLWMVFCYQDPTDICRFEKCYRCFFIFLGRFPRHGLRCRLPMSTFDGYIREFKGLIRIDNFIQSSIPPAGCHQSLIYLLSHAHSDHMSGLENFSSSIIYCSSITSEIVLKLTSIEDKVFDSMAITNNKTKKRTYQNLFTRFDNSLLKPLPILSPTQISIPTPQSDQCLLTLIPANHCPGSVMFLIQMWQCNVLYTGDIRAEPWWVEALTKESILAPYLIPIPQLDSNLDQSTNRLTPYIPLDNIYLDTSSLLSKIDVLSKEEALTITMEIMSLYPSSTIFFINAWTWGYEELLQRIAIKFQTKIHVDPFKFEVFSQSNFQKHYPLLFQSLTLDPNQTRFHACERRWRCQQAWGNGVGCLDFEGWEAEAEARCLGCQGKRIVMVNPWEITKPRWQRYKANLDIQLLRASQSLGKISHGSHDPWPAYLICPFNRHSSLTELHQFVSIFRPKALFPNTTHISTGFVEFVALPMLFGDVLYPGFDQQLKQQFRQYQKDYEARFGRRVSRNIMEIDNCFGNFNCEDLVKISKEYEELEFKSERYQTMWNDYFQTFDVDGKKEAAKLIEGSSSHNQDNQQDHPEIIEIDSD